MRCPGGLSVAVDRHRPRKLHLVAGIALALAGVLLWSGQAFGQEPPPSETSPFEPDFDHSACPYDLDVPSDVTLSCGFVTVLEDRATLSGSTIDLYVVRIQGPRRFLNRDPIIYLAGGPGGSATRRTQRFIDDAPFLYTERDLILFDQRGIGGSKPRLECSEYRHGYADVRHLDLSPEDKLRWKIQALIDCRKTLTAQGIDMNTYTSASTAADVVDIASAMGYESVNLYGASYGTILALTVMRAFPTNIRSVILDGVLPLQVNRYHSLYADKAAALEKFFRHCEADWDCSQRYPNLEETFWKAVDRYTAEPFILEYYDRYADDYFEEEFDGDFVVGRVLVSLRSERWIPYIPFLITEIAAGNEAVADSWARPVYRGTNEPIDNSAAWASMACYSYGSSVNHDILASDRETHRRFVNPDSPLLAPALCEWWQRMPVDPIENEAVVSDIPTLLLSGQFDPTTPPRWADLAAETLSNGYSFVMPMAGHGVALDLPCAQHLVERFLAEPNRNPASKCPAGHDAKFSDMYLNSGPRTMETWEWDSNTRPIPVRFEWWMDYAHWLAAMSAVTIWPFIFIVSLVRRVPSSTARWAGPARVVAALALFASLVFARSFLDINDPEITDDLVRNFGYYSSVRPWFIVPYLVAAATAIVLYLTFRAWRDRWWSLFGRVHYTLAALTLVWSLAKLARWDFIGL